MLIHAIMTVLQNFLNIRNEIPGGTEIVAVTKFRDPEEVMEVYNAGHKIFGENKVQEIIRKRELLPHDVQWHMIGHLQTNKVKYIAPYISMIHSIDSLKLLAEVNKQAQKHNRVIDCLLQFYIATEETKYGLDLTEAIQIIESEEFKKFKNIELCGVMGMASLSDDMKLIRSEFQNLKAIFTKLKTEYFQSNTLFKHISMGMTNDYHIAVEEGSTIVRIGSKIFD